MSTEIDELRAIVAQMAIDEAKRSEAAEARAENMAVQAAKMQEDNAKLIAALANQPQVVQPQVAQQGGQQANVAAVRSEKLAKLSLALRKSGKVKDFRDAPEIKVRDWLKRFDQELLALKKMSGIDDDLQRQEVIDCLKDKLDYCVCQRLDTTFQAKDPVLTWDAVTVLELHTVLIEEYGRSETDVSSVLLQFGPNRLKKTPDTSVAKFYHMWQEQLPECMMPDSDAQNARFVDLVRRALFYFCLDDRYLQEQLCNLKGDNLTLKMFLDEACVAEQKRKSFQEIGVSSSHLDSSSGISVNKWEPKGDKFGSNRGKSRWRGRYGKSGGAADSSTRQEQYTQVSHPPPAQQQPVENTAKSTGVKKKVPGACFRCHQYGHYANRCPDRQQSVKKAEVIEATCQQDQAEFTFNSLGIVANETCVKNVARCQVDALATSVKTPYVTNQPMMTSVCLAGVCEAEFECDTAASHSVISAELCQRLQQQANYKVPTVVQESIAMRLADGSVSRKACGSIKLTRSLC